MSMVQSGKAPKLYGLNIFNGTVYKWNRACYGITDGKPHLRIENRVMPSGPSVRDEFANAAFWLGLMKGLPEEYRKVSDIMDFGKAKSNFLKAARHGLGSSFAWMNMANRISATELIIKELLPIAREGLSKAQIFEDDISKYLDIIEERVSSGMTGSQWILNAVDKLSASSSKNEAMVATTAGIFHRQQENKPVHTWDIPLLEEAGSWRNRFGSIEQVMKTDLVTVAEHDSIDFVMNLMGWKNIRHIPIENFKGELLGMITAKTLIRYLSKRFEDGLQHSVTEIMETDCITVPPDISTVDAIAIMKKHDLTCLPVLKGKKLVGLLTDFDFVNISSQLLGEINPIKA